MSSMQCTSFIPMMVQGQLFCQRCGIRRNEHVQQHQQLLQQVVQQHDYLEKQEMYPQQVQQQHEYLEKQAMYPPNWENNPQMENLRYKSLRPDTYVEGNISNPQTVPPAYENVTTIKSFTFTSEQLVSMFNMAESLDWTLKGRFRDPVMHRFCAETGVTWSQFSNWVHRNRDKFGGPRG